MRGIVFLLAILVISAAAIGQEPSYRQLTVKDGLPGSIVYNCLQDAKGFIWFATNQGVSRFDGRNFRNFTKEDGLPDNDILKLYLDQYDNIWFISFIGTPSVLYHDSIIRFDKCKGVLAICEDRIAGTIQLIMSDPILDLAGYYHSPNRPGQWHFTPELSPVELSFGHPILRAATAGRTNFYFSFGKNGYDGSLVVKNENTTARFAFSNGTIHNPAPFSRPQNYSVLPNGKSLVFFNNDSAYQLSIAGLSPLFALYPLLHNHKTSTDVNSLFCEDDTTLWICTRSNGLLCVRDFSSPHPSVANCFPGVFCTSIIRDQEGGYWITTYSDGVYYCPNLSFHNFSGPAALSFSSVRSLHAMDSGHLVAGYDNGNIMVLDRNSLHYRLFPRWAARNANNRIMDVLPYIHHTLLVAADVGLHLLSLRDTDTLIRTGAFKELFIKADNHILAGTSEGILLLHPSGRLQTGTIPPRATCLAGLGNNFYWGSHRGVHAWQNGGLHSLQSPLLSGVIGHIDIAPDSALWISTEEGVVIWKAGVAQRIGKEQQLASNLCKQISFDGNTAWIATDKGISRIEYRWHNRGLRYTVVNITEEDGLRSDDINRTVIAGGNVWAATARGISFFPESYTGRSSVSLVINITRIAVAGEPVRVEDSTTVNYGSGKLLLELAGISYRSGRHIGYEYRLNGPDSTWNRLTNNTIEFPTLSYGRFVLEVRTIDRWGGRSTPKSIFILHPRPFYRSWGFIVFAYLLITLLSGAGLYTYARRRQRQRDKEYQLRRKMQELELSALRSQMNPHFIFNCLTSIQYYILRSDVTNANSYLHKFSSLIRLTLQYSTYPDVPLHEEIRMLTLYLELEKLRLGHRMNYRLYVAPELQGEHLSTPSMIIQPYVENAVRHGITPLEDRSGELLVEFRLTPHYIRCTIEDNGAGIGQARTGQQNTGHISLGTGITARRIQTINSIYKQKILIDVIDKSAAGLAGSGTIVHLSFPLKPD